jgi:hypothetical protein
MQVNVVAEGEITVTEANVCRLGNKHITSFSSKTATCKALRSVPKCKLEFYIPSQSVIQRVAEHK